MGWYTDIDKKLGGILPGGYVAPTQPTTPTPTKSTTPNIQPTVPSMTITLPSGNKVTPSPVQTSPSIGGGGYVAPRTSGGSSGGGSSYTPPTPSGYIGQPVSQQPKSTIEQINTPASNAFTPYLPEAKTISRQIQEPVRNSIIPSSDYGLVKPYSQSFYESSKQSISNVLRGDFENTFTPFGRSGSSFQPTTLFTPILEVASFGKAKNLPTEFFPQERIDIVRPIYKKGNEMSFLPGALEKEYREKTFGLTTTGKTIEVGVPIAIEIAIDIGVMTLVPGGGTIIGAKEFLVGASKGDNFRTVLGAGFVAGGAISKASKIPYEVSVMRDTRLIGQKGFTFGEVQMQGLNKDISLVKGYREAGGLRQEINVMGSVYKDSETFLQPGSKYSLTTGGIIKNEYSNLGRADIKFIGGQTGQIGAKGFTLPVGEAGDFTATFDKGTLVKEFESSAYGKLGISKESLNKQFNYNIKKSTNEFTSDYFMGVTKDYGKGTLVTRSGKISSMELNPTREIEVSNKVFSKDMISLYHATPSKNIPSIMEQGLIPGRASGIHGVIGDSDKVFTAISRQTAENYKLMGEGREILNIQVPKDLFFEQVRKEGVGTIGQVKFDMIPSKYIEGSKDFGTGFSTIQKSTIKQTREGLLVKTNLKDFTVTKVIKQPKFETTFDITSKAGSQLGLKQLIKQEAKLSKGFLTTSTVQQFKTELAPMVKFETKSFASQVTSGLKLESVKSSSKFGGQILTGLDNKQRGFSTSNSFSSSLSKSDLSFKTSSLPRTTLASLPKQDQPQFSGLVSSQSFEFKQPELTKETFRTPSPPSFETGFKISPPGFAGIPFFGALPSFGGESVGGRTYKRKKKKKTKIAPSFTAEVFNLRGPLPKAGKFGITPFQLRTIPRGGRNTYETKF